MAKRNECMAYKWNWHFRAWNLEGPLATGYRRCGKSLGVVAHTFNPSSWEAKAGRSLRLRAAWSTSHVSEQLRLHRKTLSQENETKCNSCHGGDLPPFFLLLLTWVFLIYILSVIPFPGFRANIPLIPPPPLLYGCSPPHPPTIATLPPTI